MTNWTHCLKGVKRSDCLYVRKLDYRHREFAVRHPTKGFIPLDTVTRESCYNPRLMAARALRARAILTA